MQLSGINGCTRSASFAGNEAAKAEKTEKAEARAATKAEVKKEVNSFLSEFKKGTAVTANGNEYEKATGGKIVAGVVGAVVGTFVCPFMGTVLGALDGVVLGHLFDHFITNKERAAQADANATKLSVNA